MNTIKPKTIVLDVDGTIGPKTIACLNSVDHCISYNTLLDKRKKYYQHLAEKKEKYKLFLCGWLNRVNTFNKKNGTNKSNVNC